MEAQTLSGRTFTIGLSPKSVHCVDYEDEKGTQICATMFYEGTELKYSVSVNDIVRYITHDKFTEYQNECKRLNL